MNHEKTKKSRSAPSGGIIAWLYELLFPPKNTAADESSISPARETIPEHDSGRAEKLFAQMQQENETTMPRVVQTSSATTTRAAHQDDGTTSSAFHHHAAADGGSSSSACDSDSGSSGCD
ncbi:hypothetical protein [Cardiobacterium hominis]|uniref:hypothetical protein n=1 Tax=Cardiobacterium hominis TaxID=2718 RepID=UPI0028D15B87|nr:hypothetical protein [Cardiobacterium hominis]